MPSAERLREACTCKVYKKKSLDQIRRSNFDRSSDFFEEVGKKSVKNTLKEALLLNGCIFGAEIRFARAWRLSGDAENFLNCQYARKAKTKRAFACRLPSSRGSPRRSVRPAPRQAATGRTHRRARAEVGPRHVSDAMSSRKGAGGWTSSDPRGDQAFADSVSQGVFVLRKAPAVSKRVTARKSFFPLVPDETHEGMEARRDAYLRCWRDTDAHIEGVLREANQDAFEKLQGFVRGGFERRQALVAANHGTLPQHAAQRIPVGLVLAGGVNSDDHEETFSKLTAHLRRVGCHTALLRSRDLKARGGGAAAAAAAVAAADAREGGGGGGEDAGAAAAYVGSASGGSAGGGLGVAIRRILEQLRAGAARDTAGASSRLRVSGRSARHLKRWYREVTEPFQSGPPM